MLENKKILIISPDRWRELHVSKHHYAIELEKRNNEIYFLNPVEPGTPTFKLTKIPEYKHIYSVDFNTTIRGERFYHSSIIRIIEYFQIKLFLHLVKKKFDIVWCFSDFSFKSLDYFKSVLTVFHPVDMMVSGGISQAKCADIIFSVALNIVERYKSLDKPIYIIKHGLAEKFVKMAENNIKEIDKRKTVYPAQLKVGYAGNLLRHDIDHRIFLKIVKNNPDVKFHLWGPYDYESINVEYDRKEFVQEFINELRKLSNVTLYGLCNSEILAENIQEMDMFLICYDPEKEINKCSNNHKILEYLSTGKCVISNYIMSYDKHRELVEMPTSLSNEELPYLFERAKENIEKLNSADLMLKRLKFSVEHSYKNQVNEIDNILNEQFTSLINEN